MCIRDSISPVQSPTSEQPLPNADRESPAGSKIQPTRERNPNRDLNAQTISESPPPSGFQIRTGMYELTTPYALCIIWSSQSYATRKS